MRVRTLIRLLAIGALLGLCRAVFAIDAVEISLGRVEGESWTAEGVVGRLMPGPAGRAGIELSIKRLVPPAPLEAVTDIFVSCAQALIGPPKTSCDEATLRLRSSLLDAPAMTGSFSFDHATGGLRVHARDVALASGRLELQAVLAGEGWRLTFNARRLALKQLLSHLGGLAILPAGLSGSGRLELKGKLAGAGRLETAAVDMNSKGLALSDGTGLHEGQDMELSVKLEAGRESGRWQIRGETLLARGAVYLAPYYLEVTKKPLRLAFDGRWQPETGLLDLENFDYQHPGVLHLTGALTAGRSAEEYLVQRADVRIRQAALQEAYPIYLQPLVQDGLLKLESDGSLTGRLSWDGHSISAGALELADVFLDDEAGRFGLYGASGSLRWGPPGAVEPSRLRLEGGHIYRLSLGQTELEALAEGQGVRLLRPAEVPVFDGKLRVEDLVIDGLATPELRWQFQGILTPVSMEAVSQALGWTSFGGSLSGVIPAVSYREGTMRVDGALLIRAFDGEVVIHDLLLERLFGVVPRLQTQIDIRNLDLGPLTGAFSFGNIQGRMDGFIRDLRLENWQPAAFDARFYTPEGDRSRHRISQRAVDNLARLGGAGGALSRTFMGLFKQFPYDRLGIGCRLREGVCEMDGIGAAKSGYYIVKGGGIPRIDIIGYNRRVAWDTLVKRLRDATVAGAPTVR